MKKALFSIAIGCAACSIWIAAPAQAGSQSEQNDQSQNSYSSSGTTSTKTWSHSAHSNHLIRASRLTGAEVNDTSGSRIGRIEDILINPTSGRIDFAVLSLNASGSASSPSSYNSGTSSSHYNSGNMGENSQGSTSSPNSGGTADTANSSSSSYSSSSTSSTERLIPVPWSLLRPASSSYSSTTTSSSANGNSSYSTQQHSFTVNVDRSKLEQAPSLNRGNWSEMSQTDWRSHVYSYYGISAESSTSTGSAESPSGVSQGQGAERLTNQENSPTSSSQNP